MTSEKKPRVWTIMKDRVLVFADENQRNYESVQIAAGDFVGDERVKVIEKSAYDDLAARLAAFKKDHDLLDSANIKLNEKLTDAEKMIEGLVGALKFYDGVHRLNWAIDMNDLAKIAATALAEYEKIKNKGETK